MLFPRFALLFLSVALLLVAPSITTTTTTAITDLASQPYGTQDAHGPRMSLQQMSQLLLQQRQRSTTTRATTTTTDTGLIEDSHSLAIDSDPQLKGAQASVATTLVARSIGNVLNQGRLFVLRNPRGRFAVYEPVKGCGNGTATVLQTAERRRCRVATNAGFFNTRTGDCLGNVVSDGRSVQVPGTRNVNFGVTREGKIVVGYLAEEQIRPANQYAPPENVNHTTRDGAKIYYFEQLVAGVVWLVRNGRNFVRESALLEDMRTQETGPSFTTVKAGRTALAHDSEGRIMLLQMDGDRHFGKGPNLFDFANLLIEYGAINAINLDGGGSSTSVHNLAVVNYPSDGCEGDDNTRCERGITTIACFHDLPSQEEEEGAKTKELEKQVHELQDNLHKAKSRQEIMEHETESKMKGKETKIQSLSTVATILGIILGILFLSNLALVVIIVVVVLQSTEIPASGEFEKVDNVDDDDDDDDDEEMDNFDITIEGEPEQAEIEEEPEPEPRPQSPPPPQQQQPTPQSVQADPQTINQTGNSKTTNNSI